MYKNFVAAGKVLIVILLLLTQTAKANVLAIDLAKIKYGAPLENRVVFLKQHVGIYSHWVHDWISEIPKDAVLNNLTTLYADLEKLPTKNTETFLLLGDIAHYLYNMETQEYYKKAVDNYTSAKALSPNDYRVYWFLGNHYSLSAQSVMGIDNYNIAFKYPRAADYDVMFWADYAIACTNAGMLSTGLYAARQATKAAGQMSVVEKQLTGVTANLLKPLPPDTTLTAKEMWYVMGLKDKTRLFTNRVLGIQMGVDTSWKLNVGDLKNGGFFMMMPPRLVSAKGQNIGFSVMVMARPAAAGETLAQQAEKFVGKQKDVKQISFDVGKLKNCLAFEVKNPNMYQEMGGSRLYAILIERDMPEFPGIAIELPVDPPRQTTTKVAYYRPLQKYSRLKGKLFYTIMLDSCEDIFAESSAIFKDMVNNKIIIE